MVELMLSKNGNIKKCATKLQWKKNWERFQWFLTYKIDLESQILVLFDSSPLTQFLKFNNFLWVCWFLGKNLSNFVPPAWKLDNPYCHTVYDVRLIVSYRSYNLNVILVRILDETYISSPFLDPHGSAKILYFSIEIFHA